MKKPQFCWGLFTLSRLGDTGLEQYPETPANQGISETGDAQSDALSANSAPVDPDLAAITAAWPGLPAALKAGIVAMVNAAKSEKE